MYVVFTLNEVATKQKKNIYKQEGQKQVCGGKVEALYMRSVLAW